MNKYDFNTSESLYLNEYNHNDNGNPHPQYLGINNYRIVPNVGHGNFIKLFSIVKDDSYKYVNENCSVTSIFEVTKINKGDESHCRIKLSAVKTGSSVNVTLACLDAITNLYQKIWCVPVIHDNKLTLSVYLEYSGNDYFATQNLFHFSSSELHGINTEYNFDYTFGEKETSIASNKVGVTIGTNLTFREAVPSSMTSGGSKGQIAIDTNFIYICWDYNRWSRIPNKWTWT